MIRFLGYALLIIFLIQYQKEAIGHHKTELQGKLRTIIFSDRFNHQREDLQKKEIS